MSAPGPQSKQMAAFEAALPSIRPELHRYCARMTGSVIDGEDVLQDTLLNAARALATDIIVTDLRAWLFRIAHNTALNMFRSRKNDAAMKQELAKTTPPTSEMPTQRQTADNLRPFLTLTPKQRSSVILRDVLGYSAAEVADLTQTSVTSVKSALHRGRTQLKKQSSIPKTAMPPLSEEAREKLATYATHFNAHQFDQLRDVLSEEVRLELVSVEKREGKQGVSGYYSNYQKRSDWLASPGIVEGRPAILINDQSAPSDTPAYFILLEYQGRAINFIRDFRYARYIMADATWQRL